MFDQNLAETEISDFNAEIGMLGAEEHEFFVNGGEKTLDEIAADLDASIARMEILEIEIAMYICPF